MKRIFEILLVSVFIFILLETTNLKNSIAVEYPTKAVTFVVPWPPGGRTDLTARVVTQFLKNYLNQPIVVVNKPGAGGVLGAKEVARAKPDGYTIGFFSTGFIAAKYTSPTPTDLKEYELISMVNLDPAALAVGAHTPWKSIREYVSYAKKNPKKVKNGWLPGGSAQVFAAVFMRTSGIEVSHIPYKGDSEAAVSLAGGHIDSQFAVPVSFKSLADAGKIRILGVAGESREGLYREFPTFKEEGVDLVIGSWHGLFAPKGTPIEIIRIIDRAIEKTMKDPELIDKMNKSLLGIEYKNREEFIKFIEREDNLYAKITEELGLRVSPKK